MTSSPAGEGPVESDAPPEIRFRAYAADMRHGAEMMTARLNTVLSSQSFLAIAYATSMASAHGRWHDHFTLAVPPVLALLGFLLSMAGHFDIRAVEAEVTRWRWRAIDLLAEHPELRGRLELDGTGLRHDAPRSSGELVATRAPLIFMAGWAWFFTLPLIFYAA